MLDQKEVKCEYCGERYTDFEELYFCDICANIICDACAVFTKDSVVCEECKKKF